MLLLGNEDIVLDIVFIFGTDAPPEKCQTGLQNALRKSVRNLRGVCIQSDVGGTWSIR